MNKIETTQLQKDTADNLIAQKAKGERQNKGKAIRDAGGSESVSHKPSIITESKGFRQYMADNSITEESLAKHLGEDLAVLGAGERLAYLKFIAELLGVTSKDVNINVHQQVDEDLAAMRDLIDNAEKDKE